MQIIHVLPLMSSPCRCLAEPQRVLSFNGTHSLALENDELWCSRQFGVGDLAHGQGQFYHTPNTLHTKSHQTPPKVTTYHQKPPNTSKIDQPKPTKLGCFGGIGWVLVGFRKCPLSDMTNFPLEIETMDMGILSFNDAGVTCPMW